LNVNYKVDLDTMNALKSPHPRDAVIVSALRTPLCRARKGALAKVSAFDLLVTTFKHTLKASAVDPSTIEDICIGNVLAPPGFNGVARMAALSAGIPNTAALSVSKRECASGLQAVSHIATAIMSGEIDVGIGGGVESMSENPMTSMSMPNLDFDNMSQEALDCLLPMGVTSENVAKKYGLKRKELDEFALQSMMRATVARKQGKFRDEIIPVEISPGKFQLEDDGIRPSTTLEKLSKLKPVFDSNGSSTAGNSSQMTDGAAMVLLMSRAEANKRNFKIMAVWKGYATVGVPPRIMGIGPAVAIPKVLAKAGLRVEDIDLFEINEAFASQALWSIRELGIDMEKVNVNGGAIALGHPLGCTGSRQIATLLNEMKRSGGRFGVISMCIGTGMGAAAIVEVEGNTIKSRFSKL